MKAGLWNYIKAAFNARPWGMFVAPNWVALAAVGILGAINPGVWLVGAGLELAYLYALATNKRFQNTVDGQTMLKGAADTRATLQNMLNALSEPDRQRYRNLERRCQAVLEQQHLHGGDALGDLRNQGEGLGKLLWIYLRLLVSRQAFARLVRQSAGGGSVPPPIPGDSLERRAERIETRLQDTRLSDDLRKSLQSQLDILRQRINTQREAHQKLAFLEAELSRVEEQVELLREQAIVSTDPATVSSRIDRIAGELSGTNQWIRDQQEIYGQVADVLEEPPPVVVGAGGRVAE